jgi:uncharacterized protein (UPF0335 family)
MTTLQASAQKQLRQLIEQVERLEEEKKALAGDIRDKFAEAKGLGFDVKVMRKVISLRKKTRTEREEEDSILSVYLHALGMLDSGAAPQQAEPEAVLDAAEEKTDATETRSDPCILVAVKARRRMQEV